MELERVDILESWKILLVEKVVLMRFFEIFTIAFLKRKRYFLNIKKKVKKRL
jgi:hypothetical protein